MTRTRLWLAGLVPALLLLAFAGRVGWMLDHQGSGEDAYAGGDFAAATQEYDANRRLNVLQRWIAPFDAGVAAFRAGEHADAVARYRESLAVVPAKQECLVRINLALAFEALGDTAAAEGDRPRAEQHWQAGVTTLSDGGCTDDSGSPERTDDAGSVDRRLREKLPPEQHQPPPSSPPPTSPPEDDDAQEKLLEERNQRGLEERRESDQYQGYDRLNPEYNW